MTKEEIRNRNNDMVAYWKTGKTYEQVAERYGISRARVGQILGKRNKCHFHALSPEQCVYPNLRKWLNENQISRAEFCRRMCGEGSKISWFSAMLKGKGNPSKSTIDKMLEVSGMTYEELFHE